MNPYTPRPLPARAMKALVLACAAALIVIQPGCDDAISPDPAQTLAAAYVSPTAAARPAPVVDVTSTGMNLQVPAEIPSGWTTFRFNNRSGVTHFFLVERLPEGKTVEDSRAEVVPVFQAAMDLIVAGDPGAGFAEFANLPDWFPGIVFGGGPGLTAPGRTAETTLFLEPGTYAIECYVKTADGTFHSSLGMIEGLTVTEASSGGSEPKPTLDVTIANGGIEIEGTLRPGMHTIAVHFAEQMAHEHLLGHDVHLARIDDGTDMDALAAWMDWTSPGGLASPAPAEFLGGTQEMAAGQTVYVAALLTPGQYALIAEVPNPAGKNMLKTFTVPSAAGN
jgi:hypothetical protein